MMTSDCAWVEWLNACQVVSQSDTLFLRIREPSIYTAPDQCFDSHAHSVLSLVQTSGSQCISTFLPSYMNQLSNQNNEQRLKHGKCPSGSGLGGTGSNINNGDVFKQCQPVEAHSTGYYLLKYRSLLVYHFAWCGHWVATRILGMLISVWAELDCVGRRLLCIAYHLKTD